MAFKFIYGPNGTDKTAKCMNMIERCAGFYNCIYYVVPDNMSFEAEKRIASLFGAVSEGKVNVSSFKKLYCETVNITGEKNLKKLSAGGVRILMAYVCLKNRKNLKMLGRAASSVGFAEVMAKMVEEFKIYGILPEMLSETTDKISDSLKVKLNDIATLYSEYSKFLEAGFSDAQDELGILESAIRYNPDIFDKCLFVFDGFQMFTPDELGVISALSGRSDLAFSFTTDFDREDEIYLSQSKTIKKLRGILSDIEEKQPEKAEKSNSLKNFPEGEYIIETILNGNSVECGFNPENIEIHEFPEQYQETEFVAEKIIELIKSGIRFKDIQIIARDADRYLPVIESVFREYDIPVFISKKLGAANQPAVNAVLSSLEILNNNFSYESVFSYLKSGFSNLDTFEIDLLENYIIATGIQGNSWMKKWEYIPYVASLYEDKSEFIEKINAIREKVTSPLIKLKKSLSSADRLREKCVALYKFINDIGLYDKIKGLISRFKVDDQQTAAYYGRVWNLIMQTMDEMVEVLGEKKESTEVFIDLFSLGLSMHEISIVPTNVDVVTVTDPESISENSQKIVFVVGANDGVYPSVMQTEGLLSDRDRGVLSELGIELAQDTLSKAYGENYIALKVFLSAENKLFISYPIGDTSGGARFPSVTVKRIKAAFPELEIQAHLTTGDVYGDEKIIKPAASFKKYAANLRNQYHISDKWAQAGLWYRQNPKWQENCNMLDKAIRFVPKAYNLNPEITNKLYPGNLNLSVSSLEQYAKCPFAYYANYTLKLKAREKAEITVADSGSLMHEAIEKLSGSIIKNGYSWRSAPIEFLEKETAKITDEIAIELEKRFEYTTITQLRRVARIKEMLEQSVLYIAEHLRAGKFEPLGYEIEFGDGKNYSALTFDVGGKKIRLRGKVDRADIYYDDEGKKYIRVIDYKSGKKDFDFPSMFYGLQIQLVAYLDRMCEETGANPAGILYFRLFDPVVDAPSDMKDEEIASMLENEHKMTGVVLDNDDIIRVMDSSCVNESRIIPVKYNKDGSMSKTSSVISAGDFSAMQKHINRLIKKAGKEILSGKIDISPSSFGGRTGCEYCDFKKLCFFDENCGGRYNVFEKMKTEEVLLQIKKAGEEND